MAETLILLRSLSAGNSTRISPHENPVPNYREKNRSKFQPKRVNVPAYRCQDQHEHEQDQQRVVRAGSSRLDLILLDMATEGDLQTPVANGQEALYQDGYEARGYDIQRYSLGKISIKRENP